MSNKLLLQDAEFGGAYDPSDSEDNYSEDDKKLLKKVRQGKGKKLDKKQAVLQFDESEQEEDDDDADIMGDSDIGEDDKYDDIPDSKAWGNKRKAYYNTDFVDQDYNTFNEQEEEQAQQEEEEAKAIQQRLAQQLDEADFFLDEFEATEEKHDVADGVPEATQLKSDFSDLTKRQKLQLFYKDSPEFNGLVEAFEEHLAESEQTISPAVSYAAKKNLKLPCIEFVQTRNNIILTYCTNVSFYLLLKANRVSIKNHPITKRLVQLRKLLLQLQEKYENVIKPQLEVILSAIESGEDIEIEDASIKKPVKKLSILSKFGEADNEAASDEDELVAPNAKKPKISMDSDSEEEQAEGEDGEEGEDGDERRGITYQIAKNKGVMPYRKKELRNPRVKHRNKFRKANIRRKGAVRTVRTETSRYGGEMSGIKATVRKSIKIKS